MNPESIFFKKVEATEKREADEEGLKNLKEFLRQTSERLREAGVPVRPNCRIEMDEFQNAYNIKEIERDKREIMSIESRMDYNEATVDKRLGEQLEMLKTGVFNKFLPASFVTVRASKFDDIKNGVDNVIVDLKSGNVICALDEVGELASDRFKAKQERILKINNKGGVTLKYALAVQDGKVTPSKALRNIPIFCLALPPTHIREGVRRFVSAIDQPPSSYEKKIFEYLVSLMDSQIKLMALTPEADKNFLNRLETFREGIERIRLEV